MRALRFLLVVSLVALCIACDRSSSTSTTQPTTNKHYTLAMIPKGTTHEFWKSVHAGAIHASHDLYCTVIWKGPLKEDDRESQISTVENFVGQKIDGICLAPLDDQALVAQVAQAKSAGMPVVIFDSGLKSEDYVSFVATDNYKGGQIAGEHLTKLLNGKGKIVMLRYQEGSASTMQREQGFLDAIAQHKDIVVVSSNQHGGATTETAFAASENLLAPLRTTDQSALTIDGIFCPNESTTFGMLRALQAGGFAGKVKFVGFDSSIKLAEALRGQQIHGLVLQDPMKMGYVAVKTMVDHLNGQQVSKRIDTGAKLVTLDNMDTDENKNLLMPDLKSWLGE